MPVAEYSSCLETNSSTATVSWTVEFHTTTYHYIVQNRSIDVSPVRNLDAEGFHLLR